MKASNNCRQYKYAHGRPARQAGVHDCSWDVGKDSTKRKPKEDNFPERRPRYAEKKPDAQPCGYVKGHQRISKTQKFEPMRQYVPEHDEQDNITRRPDPARPALSLAEVRRPHPPHPEHRQDRKPKPEEDSSAQHFQLRQKDFHGLPLIVHKCGAMSALNVMRAGCDRAPIYRLEARITSQKRPRTNVRGPRLLTFDQRAAP